MARARLGGLEQGRAASGDVEELAGDGLLLAFCNAYATMLTVEVLPRFTSRILGGAGFAALTQLFRELAKSYIREAKRVCCPSAGPEEVLARTAEVNAARGGGGFTLMPVRVSRGPGRLDVAFNVGRDCDELCMAPFLGLVAGVFEEAGYRVVMVSSRHRLRMARGRADYAIYPLAAHNGQLVVRVERLPSQ